MGNDIDSERANVVAKKYPSYQSEQIGDVEAPMKLLSSDEKIEELTQIIEEQKAHMGTLEQERAELIDSKADFMSEKINEIVNREVNKELERIKNNPDDSRNNKSNDNDTQEEYEDSDEFLIHTTDVLAVTQSMVKDLKIQNREYNEENECDMFAQLAKIDPTKNPNNGFEMMMGLENSKVCLQFNQVTERVVALYQKLYDLIDNSKENQSFSQSNNSYRQSQSNSSSVQDRIYERKLPPNVEEMLKQKRQQLANQLSHQ